MLQDDGGGGGGDGWGWERTARNLLPNLAFLALYFAITSYGGDGWGGGFFGKGSLQLLKQHRAKQCVQQCRVAALLFHVPCAECHDCTRCDCCNSMCHTTACTDTACPIGQEFQPVRCFMVGLQCCMAVLLGCVVAKRIFGQYRHMHGTAEEALAAATKEPVTCTVTGRNGSSRLRDACARRALHAVFAGNLHFFYLFIFFFYLRLGLTLQCQRSHGAALI